MYFWKMVRLLPGRRIAGREWVGDMANTLKGLDFKQCADSPSLFHRSSDQFTLDVHMDDGHGCAPRAAAERFVEEIGEVLNLKGTQRILARRCWPQGA